MASLEKTADKTDGSAEESQNHHRRLWVTLGSIASAWAIAGGVVALSREITFLPATANILTASALFTAGSFSIARIFMKDDRKIAEVPKIAFATAIALGGLFYTVFDMPLPPTSSQIELKQLPDIPMMDVG